MDTTPDVEAPIDTTPEVEVLMDTTPGVEAPVDTSTLYETPTPSPSIHPEPLKKDVKCKLYIEQGGDVVALGRVVATKGNVHGKSLAPGTQETKEKEDFSSLSANTRPKTSSTTSSHYSRRGRIKYG
ncbi:uncharacterized protein LOC133824343 isoform X2 [Humulus lupulus]|uniref:uncharacterized protein LOC133824343 isoform X2 n=1 Tax=Humulus lupulus TaxID=3486 RepID=UPI002B40AB57|nr:uncharacterized protein LOC133824343 isoform X2 [Humulus lupulus]